MTLRILPLVLLSLLLRPSCAPQGSSPQGSPADAPTEGAPVDTLDEYLSVYCSQYAVDCGIHPDVSTCIDITYEAWLSTCVVVDGDALDRCADWIASIHCDEEGWLEDCDLALECGE